MTFVEDVLNGRAALDDIDTYRDEWDESGEGGADYRTSLGLLWPEYAMCVENDDVLAHVVEARRSGQDLRTYPSSRKDISPTTTEVMRIG